MCLNQVDQVFKTIPSLYKSSPGTLMVWRKWKASGQKDMQDIKYLRCRFVPFIGLVSLFFGLFSCSSVSSSCADSCCPVLDFSPSSSFSSPISSCFWSLFWCLILDVCDFRHLPQMFHRLCDNSSALLVFFMFYLASSSCFSPQFRGFCLPLFWCLFLCVLAFCVCHVVI